MNLGKRTLPRGIKKYYTILSHKDTQLNNENQTLKIFWVQKSFLKRFFDPSTGAGLHHKSDGIVQIV